MNPRTRSGRGKGVEEPTRVYLQKQMHAWLAADPRRKAKDLAALLGLTEAQVANARNRGIGIGWHTLKGMARVLGLSVEEFEAQALAEWNEKPTHLRSVQEGDYVRNGDLPGWAEAEAAAREHMNGMPGWTFDVARQTLVMKPRDGVTVQYVIDEAIRAFKYSSPDQALYRTNEEFDRRVEKLRKPKPTKG